MKKVLRLKWEICPDGYRIEERDEVRFVPKTIAHGDGVIPGGTFIVPRSGKVVPYTHEFGPTALVYVDLLNAVRRLSGTGTENLYPVECFANRWGLPDRAKEAN